MMINKNTPNTTSNKVLMPRAVAIWLIENTSLTFKQIAKFCNLHALDVEALANEEQGLFLKSVDPVLSKQTTYDAIKRAEADELVELEYLANQEYDKYVLESSKLVKSKQSKYKRQSKPEAILWLIQNYSQVSDYQISKLLKSTSSTVKSIRAKTYWNYKNLHPKNPVILGLCSEENIANLTK